MHIADFLAPTSVTVGLQARSKPEVLREIAEMLASCCGLTAAEVQKVLEEREALASTGIGLGVALPHGRTASLPGLVAVLAIATHGIDFEAQDGQPVHIFVGLLAPLQGGDHLKALARLSRLLRQSEVRERLVAATSASDAYGVLVAGDT